MCQCIYLRKHVAAVAPTVTALQQDCNCLDECFLPRGLRAYTAVTLLTHFVVNLAVNCKLTNLTGLVP
jgi:hypothetical protein